MKRFYVWAISGVISFGACGPLQAGPTAYVSTDGAHVYPYDTWANAASNLQAAVDAVDLGGTVWVTNGVYATGGATVYGMSNRVALTRAVTLQSVNGPGVTYIRGQGPLGAGAVRCAYLTNGAALVGFTLTNGFTRTAGDGDLERSGGGAWLDRGGTVSNCTVSGNSASACGGGTFCYQNGIVQDCTTVGNTAGYGGGILLCYGGTVRNSTVSGNSASALGGGIKCYYGGTVQGCTVSGNSALYGGGLRCTYGGVVQSSRVSGNTASYGGGIYCAYGGTVQNGTVAGNTATALGGGFRCEGGGTLVNTVVFANTGGSSPNVYVSGTGMSFTNCCTTPAVSGTGNISADPKFVNAAAGDYRLQASSPCIDTGTNQTWMAGETDLDGKPRIFGGAVDIGAFEAGCLITVTASPNGAVRPSGSFFVPMGYPITLSFTPDADYYAADVLVDGQSLGAMTGYTFENVTNDHTVSMTFLPSPSVTYASTNGASLYPYDTWEKAAAVLQDAADVVHSGGTVWASNGVYAAGGATVYGMSNRVALTRAITLQSVNGPDVTFIKGQGPLGAGAVRCAYLTNGAALVGFTLTNGFTQAWGDGISKRSGGGVFLDEGATVSNCTASGNSAAVNGGGVFCNYSGMLQGCAIFGNTAFDNGGGVCNYGGVVQGCAIFGNLACCGGGIYNTMGNYCRGDLHNCTVSGNAAEYGGGIYALDSPLYNCTVSGNAAEYGGGIYNIDTPLYNCTVSGNTAEYGGGVYYVKNTKILIYANSILFANTGGSSSNLHINAEWSPENMRLFNCCIVPLGPGPGNISADPLFVNAAAGDYRLQTNSPCINAGYNQAWMAGATDLDGRPRVIHGAVDIGAYEAILPGWDEDADGLPDEWEWGKARTLTGLAPDADADGDGADNLAEYGADTDPFSGSSLLLLTSIILEAGGTRVAWRGGRDAWQFLERSTNLSAGAAGWTAVYTNAPPTAFSAEALDATPAGGKAFYRVRAQR